MCGGVGVVFDIEGFSFFFFNEPHLDVSFAGLTLVASQRRQKKIAVILICFEGQRNVTAGTQAARWA